MRWVLIVVAVLFVVGVFSFIIMYAVFSRDLPDPNNINNRVVPQSTQIYDRTGKHLLYDIHGDQKRTVVTLTNIADGLKHATVAIEDKEFYKHKGYDLRGIFRAVFSNITHLNPTGQGGSTITQQLVKQTILTSRKSYIRKLKEIVLAYQLEKRFSKDEILQMYLNEIPYGSNIYGAEAAAQTYFGITSKELSLAQSAMLAALPQSPTYYSPYGNHTDALFRRQRVILDAMADQGYITNAQRDAAKQEKVVFQPHRDSITAPHFVFYVRELLTEKYGEQMVDQGGLKVITTLDVTHQKAAEDAIVRNAPQNEKQWGATNAAMVSLDTKTGQILAMVGSRDFFDTENDGNFNVALSPRQPGSSFKPFVYATAFSKGYTSETMLFDLVTNFDTGSGKPYIPHNYDGREHGPVSLRQALAGSLNIPAVKVLYLAGVNTVLDNADKLGYTSLKDRSRFGLSLVLGGAEVSLLEHTSAYATLAREGVRHPTTPILRVEDKNGKTLERYKKVEVRALDQNAVRNINGILTDNSARAYIFGSNNHLTLPDRPVAAKTGTTNDYHDAWTLGYTPSLAAGFWVGNNDNSAMKRGADGSVIAAPMWQAYMKTVLAGVPVETFQKPPVNTTTKPILHGQIDVVQKLPVDTFTGKVIPESCRDTYPKQYVTMKGFKETHTILRWVVKNTPAGPEPADPTKDPQYAAWEKPIREWAKKHNYPDLINLPMESCDRRSGSNTPTISITSPSAKEELTTSMTTFSANVASIEALKSVTFAIDGETIATLTAQPFNFDYTNARFLNGTHVFSVTATDAQGVESSSERTFSYALPSSASIARFVSPQNNAVFAPSDFPLEVNALVFSPAGLVSVDLLVGGMIIGTQANPSPGNLVFSLASLPSGTQTLTLRATPKNGSVFTTTLPIVLQSSGGQ
ncbi:MAG: PBP1A family penicillin-binding protein [bacterium]